MQMRETSLLWPSTQCGEARVVNLAARLIFHAVALSSIAPVRPKLYQKAETIGGDRGGSKCQGKWGGKALEDEIAIAGRREKILTPNEFILGRTHMKTEPAKYKRNRKATNASNNRNDVESEQECAGDADVLSNRKLGSAQYLRSSLHRASFCGVELDSMLSTTYCVMKARSTAI